MARTIKIKNLQDIYDVYCGQGINAGEYYTLDSDEVTSNKYAVDQKVQAHLATEKILINNGTEDLPYALGKMCLEGSSPVDADNATIVRIKTNTAGWHFQDRYFNFITSTLGSLKNYDENCEDRGDAEIKFYNASGTELTDQPTIDTDCVRTVVDVIPPYDFEVIESGIFCAEKTTESVICSSIICPDISSQYGGSKCVLSGADLSQKNEYSIEGRSVKRLNYSGTLPATNKLRVQIQHPAGFKVVLNVDIDHFKE